MSDHIQNGTGRISRIFIYCRNCTGNTIFWTLLSPTRMDDDKGTLFVQFFHDRIQYRIT